MKRLFRKNPILATLTIIFAVSAAIIFCFAGKSNVAQKVTSQTQTDAVSAAINDALYTRAEFFGAQTIVPFPTADARKNLAELIGKYPNQPRIFLKLSEFDEKLGDYEKAEKEINNFVQLNFEDAKSLETFTAFYGRRGDFEKEAATLERILRKTAGERRSQILRQIIELARRHKLENYLQPDFYRQIIAEDSTVFAIIEQFIEKLIEEKDYRQALEFVRNGREQFPAQSAFLLNKEIEILLADKRAAEAEAVYHKAFDPFWSQEESEKYYQFLSEHDRLRAYKNELLALFKKDPADFDAAVRLFHCLKNDYGEEPAAILLKLEKERAHRKINWQPQELLTAARLLLSVGEGDAASRFLYTLVANNQLEARSELRAKVLYQLFEMLSDAGEERLALTNGNLDFYRDVARSDPHPGIATGILSLIFSDTNPSKELDKKEETATRLFNRAAAYRIFEAYKAENPTSPELAQMYLDIVRLYATTGETGIAERTLAEFEARKEFENSPHYPLVSLKLADAFIAAKNYEKERAVYQKLLDYSGKKQIESGQPLVFVSSDAEPSQTKPTLVNFPPKSNQGIDVSEKKASLDDYYYYREPQKYRDFLANKNETVTYSEVLNRLVTSLNGEKRSSDILALYAAEAKKYPSEAGLYEQMLQWLGQTNLTEEQLKVYQTANKKFPERIWQDRLARWFLRQKRQSEFETFSKDLIEKFDDAETENFFVEFINRNSAAKPETFEAQFYLALYTRAHQRFPHNLNFVRGLLNYYQAHRLETEWRNLAAEYYFESAEIRNLFLQELAKTGKLRDFQAEAVEKIEAANADFSVLPYKLFRADAAARLSDYEDAVPAYRELNQLYPNTPEYAERLIAFTRSFGQTNPKFLDETALAAHSTAENAPASFDARTRAGEIEAERGNYQAAREEWRKLTNTAAGDAETYLETATVFWDYFQYDDALATIEQLRKEKADENLFAFEAGAIYEAKKDLKRALAEYVKALDGSTAEAENFASSDRAKRRLAKLYAGDKNVLPQIQTAFEIERGKRSRTAKISNLSLGYSDFLRRVDEWNAGKLILKTEAAHNDSTEFLEEARDLCRSGEDSESEQFVLQRLAATAKNTRANIKFNLQLAKSLSDAGKQNAAALTLKNLIAKFPTNYGVLSETADFYWRVGERENAINVLQTAMNKARGRYRNAFGRKLAAHFIEQNRYASAEQVLRQLYAEDRIDYGVFQELVKIYVRARQSANVEEIFNRTLSEIKRQNIDFREINDEVASLRRNIINAFTRLGDTDAGIAQHIEIINREPENEETTEAAIDYVRRYGGAQKLIDYYQKTANAAYKNYRWFVVLARIYEANKDYRQAAENYQTAIQNQPEMPELYEALATVYEKQGDLSRAIAATNKTVELSNDEPQRLPRLIGLLEKAGRKTEAETARQKLPAQEKPRKTLAEQFAEAERLKNTENAKALEIYQAAFDAVLAKPLEHDLKTAEIIGYVGALRGVEPLGKTANRLWELRDKLIAESEKNDSTEAARAREQRQILDSAITEAIGGSARDFTAGNERRTIFEDLAKRIENARSNGDETLQLLQNLSPRAGFDSLEEKILVLRKERSFELKNAEDYHANLNSLAAFYRERGAFADAINLLENERKRDFAPEKYDYLRRIAENARLIGNREKELGALREYFQSKCRDCAASEPDDLVERYFEALAESGNAGRGELVELTQNQTAFHLQLINFLIKKGERELAHSAIENSSFAEVWKNARHAQIDFVLGNFNPENKQHFESALRLKTIGELVEDKPQPEKQLVGDDWFRLANVYGKWLSQSGEKDAGRFLPALIERRPQDASEQTKLGAWYSERKNAGQAIEHLTVALEKNPQDKQALAFLGAAQFQAGKEKMALETWARIVESETPEFELYFEILEKYGFASQARERLKPVLIKNLTQSTADEDETKAQIRLLAKSFGDNKNEGIARAQAAFLLEIAKQAKAETLLSETVISESLIGKSQLVPFYELLIERSDDSGGVDYNYTELLETNLSAGKAEAALDVEENYEPEEPEGERTDWQHALLKRLIETEQNERADKLAGEIEKSIEKTHARPAWLRLAKMRLALRNGERADKILSEFKRFVGITPDAPKIVAPSLARLNAAVNLLREEKRETLAEELQTAVYARLLALEQFEKTSFSGLANIAFRRGDTNFGLKLLETMVNLTEEEQRETAARELAELHLIKASGVDRTKTEDDETNNTLETGDALKLAAETAEKFGQTEAAIEFRRRLLAFAPINAENRIELAKLLAEKQDFAEAANNFTAVMTNPRFSRKARWRAFWAAATVSGSDEEKWSALKNQLANLPDTDAEMQNALAAIELWETNHLDEAGELLKNAEFKTANLQFLDALIAKENGQTTDALDGFLAAFKSDSKPEIALALNQNENETLRQVIGLYAAAGFPRAALKTVEKEPNLNDAVLLELLSKAAEEIGNLQKSAEFETRRKSLLADENERQTAEKRITLLQNRERENATPPVFKVNRQNISE